MNIADEKPEGTIFVIPLRLEECTVPRRLRALQRVDFFPKGHQKQAYQRLLEILKLRMESLRIRTIMMARVTSGSGLRCALHRICKRKSYARCRLAHKSRWQRSRMVGHVYQPVAGVLRNGWKCSRKLARLRLNPHRLHPIPRKHVATRRLALVCATSDLE